MTLQLIHPAPMDEVWCGTVATLLEKGKIYKPRNKDIVELSHASIAVDMLRPVLTVPGRKMSYRLMAGEAHWILSGSSLLSDILPYNKNMAEFSDDGVTLAGAYGPRIQSQLAYVLNKLYEDPDTRQATLTIWYPCPKPTKDYPCTIAMDFKIRDGRLNCHVFMRSSDVWLGLPYDVFAFTAVAWQVVGSYNHRARFVKSNMLIEPGTLFITAASSHLYAEQWDVATKAVYNAPRSIVPPAPEAIWANADSTVHVLHALRDTRRGDVLRWWERQRVVRPRFTDAIFQPLSQRVSNEQSL